MIRQKRRNLQIPGLSGRQVVSRYGLKKNRFTVKKSGIYELTGKLKGKKKIQNLLLSYVYMTNYQEKFRMTSVKLPLTDLGIPLLL